MALAACRWPAPRSMADGAARMAGSSPAHGYSSVERSCRNGRRSADLPARATVTRSKDRLRLRRVLRDLPVRRVLAASGAGGNLPLHGWYMGTHERAAIHKISDDLACSAPGCQPISRGVL